MDDLRFADGTPVFEGAAVLFGSPGSTHLGRHFVHGVEAERVHLGHQHFTHPGSLVLDLSHRPTRLEFAHRLAERLAKGRTWAVFHAYDGRVRFYLGDETVDFDGSEDEFLQAWEGV